MQQLDTDYLVIGSGAMGMAFTDVLLTETNARIILVDKHHQPGGHWNDAYPFVRLHQPSAFYGVNSKQLGNNAVDTAGLNQGLYELATNEEVCTYFDQVMQRQFLPSGRVQYFPCCEYRGDGQFVSLVSEEQYSASFKKEVDATYMNVVVPSRRPPPFGLEGDVHCVPLNDLPNLSRQFADFVIVGAGKTAVDAALFLLTNSVAPDRISWVMPRDSWLLDRAQIQPTMEAIGTALANQTIPGADAETIDDFFSRIADAGGLLRIDDNIKPTMYRCSTVTRAELALLKRIEKIIRMGRVITIAEENIILEEGSVPTTRNTLHIDCAGDGLAKRPALPVFADRKLTLQSVRTCQQVFSAAFIAHVEASYDNDDKKNDLCTPVPHPNHDVDFLRNNLADSVNQAKWDKDPDLHRWLRASRLDFTSHVLKSSPFIRAMSLVNQIPWVRRANQAEQAYARATQNITRLLRQVDS